jgi:geranylgeranyl reductase family protein
VSDIYDAVIVGAGPAGSAAAIALGRRGYRVLLLDRRVFPRDKPCGDLIGARALAAVARLGIDPGIWHCYPRIAGAILTSTGVSLDLAPTSAPGRWLVAGSDARVIPRAIFDHRLAQEAVAAGAELRQATVREVSAWQGGTRRVCGNGPSGSLEVLARAVIVTGGYGCRVAPEVAARGRNDGPARGIAMRAYFQNVACPADRIVFSLDRWLLPGYGWIFPLPDGCANVGVGTLVTGDHDERRMPETLQTLWRRFTTDPASPAMRWLRGANPVDSPRAWPLDLGPRRRRLVADGLLVAGEAAGLVGPLTGAGIAFALESGEQAGEQLASAVAAGDVSGHRLKPYGHEIRRRTAPWLRAELLAQRFLSDPNRAERFFTAIRPLPPTGALGARLLLHLG